MIQDTGASRAAAFKSRQREKGLIQVNVWVPAGAAPAIKEAAEVMCAHSGARGLRVVDVNTGRIVARKQT